MADQFLEIIERAILEAERINCDFGDFVDGLRDMHDELSTRLNLAEDELSNLDGRGD
jgi:RNAse (barnase) inhibitor barstar